MQVKVNTIATEDSGGTLEVTLIPEVAADQDLLQQLHQLGLIRDPKTREGSNEITETYARMFSYTWLEQFCRGKSQ